MLAYDWNFLGLSTETKPLSGEKVVDGSTFYECDTCNFYIYYNGNWYQQVFVTENGINFWLYKALMKKMFGKLFDSNITKAKIIKPDTDTSIEFTTSLPANITNLTGYGNSTQQTYSGKNLFGVGALGSTTNGSATISDGIITLIPTGTGNSIVRLNLIKPLPAGSYTLNSSTYLSTATQLRDANDSLTIYNFASSYQNVTFTTTDEAPMIRFNFLNPGNTNPIYIDLNTLQIEVGSTATSYEPYVGGTASPNPDYPQDINVVTGEQTVTVDETQEFTINLGSTELCKIGDYQDYIYKSGDDWYLHKEIGKYVFNGSEDWTVEQYGTNSWRINVISIYDFNADEIELKCDFANGVAFSSRNEADATKTCVCYTNTFSVLIIRNTTITTKEGMQTNTAGKRLFYKATPTDTKITDNTLITQLNSLLNYTIPSGNHQIVVTADDLPMALKLIITEKE